MDTLRKLLKSFFYDSSTNKYPRSMLWVSLTITILLFLWFEISDIQSMKELGLAEGWKNLQFDYVHRYFLAIQYGTIFALIHLLLLLLQITPEQYRKMKEEEDKENKQTKG